MLRVDGGRGRALRILLAATQLGLAACLFARTALAQDAPPAPSAPAPAQPAEPDPAADSELAPKPAQPAPKAAPKSGAKPAAEVPKPTERAWIRGDVRINYRTSASPTSTPLGVLTTGDGVGVIERKNGWARVLVGENSVGWLPESFLDAEPPPLEHVAMLEAQVADLQKSLDETQREAASLRAQVAEVQGKDAERDEEMRRLRDENRDLQAGERWPYLVMGAAIFVSGIVAALILRPGTRRSSSRLRY